MLSRRAFLGASLAPVLAGAVPAIGSASAYPNRPVRLVVPFARGGSTDIIARMLADGLSDGWRVPVSVENRDGSGGNVGGAHVARADADGHTVLIASLWMAVNRFLYPRLDYDPDADFAPVTLVARVGNVMVVPAKSPVRSVADFIARARQASPDLTYGSPGAGSSVHLAAELFSRRAGIRMTHVPYRGSGPALVDLEAGRVDVMFDNITSSLPRIRAGALRGLAVTSLERMAVAPELPALAETLPGFETTTWFAAFVPRGTPPGVVARLHSDIAALVQAGAVRTRLQALGGEPVGSSPEALRRHFAGEIERWGRLIQEADIRLGR